MKADHESLGAPFRAAIGLVLLTAAGCSQMEESPGPTLGLPATGFVGSTAEGLAWENEHLLRNERIVPNALAGQRLQQSAGLWLERPVGLAEVLPVAVDNSSLPGFPPIRSQGSLDQCVSFSFGYYTMTHMTALVEGWNTKHAGNDDKFSSLFLYNLINGGVDQGSTVDRPLSVLLDQGCSRWADFYPGDYVTWPTNVSTWRSAIRHRVLRAGFIDELDAFSGLWRLKQMLVNGYVLPFGSAVFWWDFGAIRDDPATAADDAIAGQRIAYQSRGSVGHMLTIVGYDDRVWYDYNVNGAVDVGEKGALKIANSWGASNSFNMNAGFYWLTYDALRRQTAASGWSPSPERTAAAHQGRAYWLEPRAAYEPILLAELAWSTGNRSEAMIWTDIEGGGAPAPIAPQSTTIFGAGGSYPFDGAVAFDFSDGTRSAGDPQRFFVRVFDAQPIVGTETTVSAFSLHEMATGTHHPTPVVLPQVIDGSMVDLYADVGVPAPPGNTPPTIGPIQDVAVSAGQASTPVAITIGDAETPVENLRLSINQPDGLWDYAWGGTGSQRTLVLVPTPNTAGSLAITVMVDDGQAFASSRFRLAIDIAEDHVVPTITPIADVSVPAGQASPPITFQISDDRMSPAHLRVTLDCNDAAFLAGFWLSGSGEQRSVVLVPRALALGTATITITVSDGAQTASTAFALTATTPGGNTPPMISGPANQQVAAGGTSGALPVNLSDVETPAALLGLWAWSDDWVLLPQGSLWLGGEDATRTIEIRPPPGQTGQTQVHLTVSDVELTSSWQFSVTITEAASTYQLHAVAGPHGSVSPTAGNFPAGTVVTLTASPEAGYRVESWTGTDNDASTSVTNTVAMLGDRSVYVTFAPVTNPVAPAAPTDLTVH